MNGLSVTAKFEATDASVYHERRRESSLEKEYIGLYVAQCLRKGACEQSIAVDGGSTNWYVLRAICQDIKRQRPTVSLVLTNHVDGIYLALDLPDGGNTTWCCTGGILRPSRAVFIGEEVERAIRECNFSTAVIGANGFVERFPQTTTGMEHPVKKAMIDGAGECVIFPIHASKWGLRTGKTLYSLDDILLKGKKIVLVTCYPFQKESETETEFRNRVSRFIRQIEFLHDTYKEIKVTTSIIKPEESEFEETTLLGGDIVKELRQCAQAVRMGQGSRAGLAIRFDLKARS